MRDERIDRRGRSGRGEADAEAAGGDLYLLVRTAGIADTIKVPRWNGWKHNDRPDLAFFDVQLADGESFEVFKRTTVDCPVIPFTTAYDEHALEGLPGERDRLPAEADQAGRVEGGHRACAVRHSSVTLDHSHPDGAGDQQCGGRPDQALPDPLWDRLKVVEPADVAYFHSMEKNTFLRTREGQRCSAR